MRKSLVAVISLILVLWLVSCADDSASRDPGHGLDVDICALCAHDEICIELDNGAICVKICGEDSGCYADERCCELPSDRAGCVPLDQDCPEEVLCRSNSDCLDDEICKDKRCVPDGDTPTDGDDYEKPEDDTTEQVEGPDCFTDPNLIWNEECGFGSVPLGSEAECVISIFNAGPTQVATIYYGLDPSTSAEFWINEEDVLEEDESRFISVGETLDITIHYIPEDPGLDQGIFFAQTVQLVPNGPPRLCNFSVALTTDPKGLPHVRVTPEPPNPLDFGPVRLFSLKSMPLRIENKMLEDGANATLRLSSFSFLYGQDRTFFLPNNLAIGGDILLAPTQYEDVLITCNPYHEGELTNTLIFQTNDEQYPEIRVPLVCEGVQPRVCTDPVAMVFGEVPIGQSEMEDLEICNCGGYPLTIDEITVESEVLAFMRTPECVNSQGQTLDMLYPEGEGPPDSNCCSITVTFAPTRRGDNEAILTVHSDGVVEEHEVMLSGQGVSSEICIYPCPLDFGRVQYSSTSGGGAPPKHVEVRNCGPEGTWAYLCCLDFTWAPGTPEGTFYLDNFSEPRPMECGDFSEINLENCIPMRGGSSANTMTFDLNYDPPDYGEHNALITLTASDSNRIDLTKPCEVRAIGTDCDEGWWDLNPELNNPDPELGACEYRCDFISETDEPDMDFIDSNCDGIDGEIYNAIFVSSESGSNFGNSGGIDDPLETIPASISAALIQHKRDVYLDLGTYYGKVSLRGVSKGIYGGYSIDDVRRDSPRGWRRAMGNRSILFSDQYVGLDVSYISQRTVIQHLTVRNTGGSDSDPSSYGIYSRSAASLVLEYLNIFSGNARNGLSGLIPGIQGNAGENGQRGQDGREDDSSWYCAMQGRPGVGVGGFSYCGERGGNGGHSCKTGGSNCAGDTGQAGVGASTYYGYGGTGYPAGPGSQGGNGADGSTGSNGSGGTTGGYIEGCKWRPNPGGNGARGSNGGGGGGGGGGGSVSYDMVLWSSCEDWGGTGGGGGGGGCGGDGGSGGDGGGSSIGIFLCDSSPEIINCSIEVGDGGMGGNGMMGGMGGRGGKGGDGGSPYDDGEDGGPGGAGGRGGRGGSGGGGAGGNSFGIYRAGNSQPMMIDNSFEIGLPGSGGNSGGAGGNDGENGIRQEVF